MKTLSSFFFQSLLVLSLLALRLPAVAQAPAWQSATAVAVAAVVSTNNFSEVEATAVDAAGNVFLAGTFANTVVLGGTTLTSLGNNDIFVAKFNPVSNQFVWAQRAGGTGGEYASALAVSGTSVYVTGYFYSSTASFGPVTLTKASVDADAFVAKLTDAGSTGSFVWAQRAGGAEADYALALAVNGSSVYVAGNFKSPTASFGAITLTNVNPVFITPRGSTPLADAFVAKLTDAGSTGSFVWAQQAGGLSDDFAYALAVSGTSVYVAGSFRGPTASFGAVTLANVGPILITDTSTDDAFVAKLTDAGSTGSFVWAQQAGSTGDDRPRALAVSGTSVYVAGSFNGQGFGQGGFGPTASFGAITLTSVGESDLFVAKLTDAGSTGSFTWAQQAGGTSYDYANALAVSGSSVYVAGGFFSPTAGFGTTSLTNAAGNGYNVFAAKLTDAGSTGRFVWAQRAGGAVDGIAFGLAVSGTSVYVAGRIASPAADFGTFTLSSANYNGLGFLATLTDPTLTATAPSRGLPPAQLYPNPARHTATLRLPAGTAPAPLTLSDALGRVVRRYPAPDGAEAALDLRGLPVGLYLLRGAGPALRLAVE